MIIIDLNARYTFVFDERFREKFGKFNIIKKT